MFGSDPKFETKTLRVGRWTFLASDLNTTYYCLWLVDGSLIHLLPENVKMMFDSTVTETTAAITYKNDKAVKATITTFPETCMPIRTGLYLDKRGDKTPQVNIHQPLLIQGPGEIEDCYVIAYCGAPNDVPTLFNSTTGDPISFGDVVDWWYL